ncbi:MAG TPA: hypothetical protein VFG04_16965 [Planctomycetaceae bacterium]|jgi:hypothetical protein|nr:hypothetical protein [Planctomycetaceae bacterium]
MRLDEAPRHALPFFRRRTVKNRIYELLEDKTVALWSAPLSRYQFVGLALIVASTGVALGGLGPEAVDSAPNAATVASNAESEPPASPAPNAPSDKAAPTTNTAAAPTTLDRILAHWKARQERTKSVYFAWESRSIFRQDGNERNKGKTPAQPANDRSRTVQFRFWAEAPDRLRLDRLPLSAPKSTATVFDVKTQGVWDGTTLTRLEDSVEAGGSPLCTIWSRRGQKPRRALATHVWPLRALELHASLPGDETLNPLALTYHPQDAFLWSQGPPQFRVLNEKAFIDGLHCVELQHAIKDYDWVENCWVDPARDDVVVAYEWLSGEDEASRQNNRQTISIQYQLDRVHGWVPAHWTIKRPREFSVSTVTKFMINEKLPQDTFTVKPAPGTVVFNEGANEEYRVAQDGSKSDVVKFESPASLRTREALAARTDFRIERQPLTDAIEFISARYQIPILLNQREFDVAHINVASEVRFTREGVLVADLLKDLLAQCSQTPIGFRIENEVLKISPKFAGQGPIQAQAIPVLEKQFDSPPNSDSSVPAGRL